MFLQHLSWGRSERCGKSVYQGWNKLMALLWQCCLFLFFFFSIRFHCSTHYGIRLPEASLGFPVVNLLHAPRPRICVIQLYNVIQLYTITLWLYIYIHLYTHITLHCIALHCITLQYIHPASRGVAAHTAGLFRSVRGAKGGFPPWGLPRLRIFPWGLPKLGNFHFSPPWGLSQAKEFSLSPPRGGSPS